MYICLLYIIYYIKEVITIKYILIFLAWFLSGAFSSPGGFYNNIEKPPFNPPSITFAIVWPILFVLITISIYLIYRENKFRDVKSYNIALISNYIFNQLFSILFFNLESTFGGFIASLGTFITSIFLYRETKKINKKASYFLIPYMIWTGFATILSLSIFILNL